MNLLLNIRAKYCFLRANGVYYNCQQKGVDRMARNTTNISIRMDADLKAQADALFTELGMNLTTAFNIFVAAVHGRKRAVNAFYIYVLK